MSYFSLYRSLHKYMSHIPCNFSSQFSIFSHILTQMSFAFSFQYQSDAFIIFSRFSSHSFHTNLNLVHVLVLVSSSRSSSIVLSLFHTNLNLVHVLVLVSSFHSSSIVLTVHFFLGLRLDFKII